MTLRNFARIVRVVALYLVCNHFVAPAVTAQAAAQASNNESLVRRADSSWTRAYATHDTLLALRVFAESFRMTATDGRLKNRRDELADVRATPGMTVEFFRSADVHVQMLEHAAVVTGVLEWRLTTNGAGVDTRRRYTATWSRGGPLGWQMVALHIGRAP